ncbi:MAG: hypothetical protein ACJA1B_002273 [Polaribacter sp.]|jgi:hypothetical protein
MKLNQYFLASLFVFCLLFSNNTTAQTTHTITLNVNTGKITKRTVNQYSNFGQSSNVSNENYTTAVKLGDYVEWLGVSSTSEEDTVEIVSINHEGGARVFEKNVLKGSNGIVIAKVTAGRVGDYEKYTIKFNVYVNGVKKPGILSIDPKITIKS